jgi:Zn-dependent protease with chaperone function
VTRANEVWRLHVALALVGTLSVATALIVAVTRVDFSAPSLAELADACRRWALPHARPASMLVLALGSLAVASLVLAARAFLRRVRAARELERRLPVVGQLAGIRDGYLLAGAEIHAFCLGWLRPRIYLSRGAVEALSEDEQAAVLAHERHHARRRDPLRLAVAQSVGEGLFLMPIVRRLADRYRTLAELAADEAAVRAAGDPAPLASALLAFETSPSPAAVGIARERVEHLMGRRPRYELSALLLMGGLLTTGVLLAVTARLAQATDDASVSLPAVLAQACMVAMAVVPLVLGAGALLGGRRLLRRP